MATLLRETDWYIAEESARGWPKTGVVSRRIWKQLEAMSDSEFNGSIALEIGITSNLRPGA